MQSSLNRSSNVSNLATVNQTPSPIHFVHLPKRRPPTSRLPVPASERAKAAVCEKGPIILPPLHRSVLIRRGKNIPPHSVLDQETTIQQVYVHSGRTVIDVPLKKIHQMPPESAHVTQLVLCTAYDPKNPKSCPKKRCRCVHADVDPATIGAAKGVHINYAWRSAEAVTYERFEAGEVLHVAVPNSKVTTDVMDSQMALKTKALESSRRPLSHCAHYYYNRTCNLGADCQFIHAVFIDPNANANQRAPLPAQIGRGRTWVAATMSLQPEEEALQNPAEAAPATFIDPLVQVMTGGLRTGMKFATPPMSQEPPSTESSLGTNATDVPPVVSSIEGSLEPPCGHAAVARAEPSHEYGTPADDEEEEDEVSTEDDSALTATLIPDRYRHNPYTMSGF